MKIFAKQQEAKVVEEHGISTFLEYPLDFGRMSVGVSKINGSYPETGVDLDQDSEAVWYVTAGTGTVTVGEETYKLKVGDMLLISAGEKYHITGSALELVVISSPPWSSQQHQHLE